MQTKKLQTSNYRLCVNQMFVHIQQWINIWLTGFLEKREVGEKGEVGKRKYT